MFTWRAWQRLNGRIEKVELNAMGRNISSEHIDQPRHIANLPKLPIALEHIAHQCDGPVKRHRVSSTTSKLARIITLCSEKLVTRDSIHHSGYLYENCRLDSSGIVVRVCLLDCSYLKSAVPTPKTTSQQLHAALHIQDFALLGSNGRAKKVVLGKYWLRIMENVTIMLLS